MTTQDARSIKIEVKNLTKRFGDLLVLFCKNVLPSNSII